MFRTPGLPTAGRHVWIVLGLIAGVLSAAPLQAQQAAAPAAGRTSRSDDARVFRRRRDGAELHQGRQGRRFRNGGGQAEGSAAARAPSPSASSRPRAGRFSRRPNPARAAASSTSSSWTRPSRARTTRVANILAEAFPPEQVQRDLQGLRRCVRDGTEYRQPVARVGSREIARRR